ncbi:MAG: hypothetical protein V4584_06120 [Verrucomicrobiota bacterium]
MESLPRAAWPSPSPVELATVAGACGWANHADGPGKAMDLLWDCAEVIHKSQESAAHFLEAIRTKSEWTHTELQKACGFDYQKLPDKITRAEFFALFNTEDLKVHGEPMNGWALFNHWHSLPEGGNLTLAKSEAWHALLRKGFGWKQFSSDTRWDFLAVMVARFNEWRRKTAARNKAGTMKNLKQNEK